MRSMLFAACRSAVLSGLLRSAPRRQAAAVPPASPPYPSFKCCIRSIVTCALSSVPPIRFHRPLHSPGLPCDPATSTCNGRNELCHGRGPAWPDDRASAAIIGARQFYGARQLYHAADSQVRAARAGRVRACGGCVTRVRDAGACGAHSAGQPNFPSQRARHQRSRSGPAAVEDRPLGAPRSLRRLLETSPAYASLGCSIAWRA
jgi:hypothetical protein